MPVVLSCLDSWTKKLPPILNETGGEKFKIEVELEAALEILTYNSFTRSFSLQKNNNNTMRSGLYSIEIFLSDKYGVSTIYDLKITLACDDGEKSIKSTTKLDVKLENLTSLAEDLKLELKQ